MIFSALISLAAFLIALIGARLLILAFRNSRLMLDVPNARSNHKVPVPKGGGLAVVFAILIPMLVANVDLSIVLAVLLLASVSMLDDLIGISPWIRLLVQMIAVSIALNHVHPTLLDAWMPHMLGLCVLGMLWIWCINMFNFMDGVDGLSAVEMISVGFGAALVIIFADQFPSNLAQYAMIFAAAGCGFWWWNRHPARIFLGDVGSVPIGFVLGYLLLLLVLEGHLAAACILPAYYFADSGVTLLRRVYRREKIWQAHSRHYYQMAVRKGWKHHAVTRYVAGGNILLGFLAVQTVLYPDLDWLLVVLAYMVVCVIMGFFRHGSSEVAAGIFP